MVTEDKYKTLRLIKSEVKIYILNLSILVSFKYVAFISDIVVPKIIRPH